MESKLLVSEFLVGTDEIYRHLRRRHLGSLLALFVPTRWAGSKTGVGQNLVARTQGNSSFVAVTLQHS